MYFFFYSSSSMAWSTEPVILIALVLVVVVLMVYAVVRTAYRPGVCFSCLLHPKDDSATTDKEGFRVQSSDGKCCNCLCNACPPITPIMTDVYGTSGIGSGITPALKVCKPCCTCSCNHISNTVEAEESLFCRRRV